MTPASYDQSLAAEDEGGGLENINDTHKNIELSPVEEDPEETEDEEVKVNCIGGFAGIQDSDMSSDEESSDEDSDDEDPEEDTAELKEETTKAGLVQFVSSQQASGLNIQRPRAVLATSPNRHDDVEEQDDDDDDSDLDESSDDDE